MDNTTPHAAADYEREVERTVPLHAEILQQAVDAALGARPRAERWLDTGCGPGRLGEIVRARCRAQVWLADPSSAMLALARARHADLPPSRFFAAGTEDLPDGEPYDVITAVQCHHYGSPDARHRAVARCFSLLAPGGALVVFENVRAETDAGHALQRERWARWLREHGRDEASAHAQLAREGTKYFPIRVSDHLAVLAGAGFAVVEPFWRSYGQAGFVCVKAPAAV